MKAGPRSLLPVAMLVLVGLFPIGLATQTAPDTIVMKGPTLDAVRFPHLVHEDFTACVTCHHESKSELPSTSDYAPCKSCHLDNIDAPMVTNARDAFHDRRAREGLCVDCHTSEREAGRTTPARCTDCHRP